MITLDGHRPPGWLRAGVRVTCTGETVDPATGARVREYAATRTSSRLAERARRWWRRLRNRHAWTRRHVETYRPRTHRDPAASPRFWDAMRELRRAKAARKRILDHWRPRVAAARELGEAELERVTDARREALRDANATVRAAKRQVDHWRRMDRNHPGWWLE